MVINYILLYIPFLLRHTLSTKNIRLFMNWFLSLCLALSFYLTSTSRCPIDITATVSVSSHRWHTHLYRCIAVSMTSQVSKSSHLAHVWHHTQSTSYHIHTLWHQWSCFMTSQTLHSWHQISSIWHHIHSLGHLTTLCMTSSPLYLSSRPLHLCHHTQHIDITATTWKVLHAVYLW